MPTEEIKRNNSEYTNTGYWGKSEGKGKRWAGNGTNNTKGRFPSNLIWDGSDEVLEVFARAGERKSGSSTNNSLSKKKFMFGSSCGMHSGVYGDTGTAARFFYCAKASRAERNRGCEGLPLSKNDFQRDTSGLNQDRPNREGRKPMRGQGNSHPCVKPLALLRYLCRLTATPTGGVILDPFAGSGSTLFAALEEGRQAVGIEIDEQYCEIAARRCEAAGRERTAP